MSVLESEELMVFKVKKRRDIRRTFCFPSFKH